MWVISYNKHRLVSYPGLMTGRNADKNVFDVEKTEEAVIDIF